MHDGKKPQSATAVGLGTPVAQTPGRTNSIPNPVVGPGELMLLLTLPPVPSTAKSSAPSASQRRVFMDEDWEGLVAVMQEYLGVRRCLRAALTAIRDTGKAQVWEGAWESEKGGGDEARAWAARDPSCPPAARSDEMHGSRTGNRSWRYLHDADVLLRGTVQWMIWIFVVVQLHPLKVPERQTKEALGGLGLIVVRHADLLRLSGL